MSHNFWHPEVELCGVILKDQTVIHVENKSANPYSTFEISEDDIQKTGLENIEIFWHSHPNNDENLSLQDYRSFLQYPHHKHRIYTENGFAEYYVRRGFVMRVEE